MSEYLGHEFREGKCVYCGASERAARDFKAACQKPGQMPPERVAATSPAEQSSHGVTTQSDVEELLRTVISNQRLQLEMLRAIRWAIVGFSIWFIVQFCFLPKLLVR